jgi:hypothetical protein
MKTFSTWLEMTTPPHREASWEEWERWYLEVEPLIKDAALKELGETGDLKIRNMERYAGVSEGMAAFLVRNFLKRHHSPDHVRVARGLEDKRRAEEEAAKKDEYLYHVTTKRRLPMIRKNGLQPNMPSQFDNYTDYSRGKVFLCEKGGVSFWRGKVEDHEEAKYDRPSQVIVLRVPRSAVEDQLQNDGRGTEDSGSPSYYVTSKIPAKLVLSA